MSEKKMERHNRWRDKTVAFRMSPQENAQLDMRVAVSGLTKQEYLINRVLEQEIIVNPNPRVEKNLRIYLQLLKTELETITASNDFSSDVFEKAEYLLRLLERIGNEKSSTSGGKTT